MQSPPHRWTFFAGMGADGKKERKLSGTEIIFNAGIGDIFGGRLIKLQISADNDLSIGGNRKIPVGISLSLNHNFVKTAEQGTEKHFETAVSFGGMIAHSAVDDGNRDLAFFAFPDQIGPNLSFKNDQLGGGNHIQSLTDNPFKINGAENILWQKNQ